jgi:hypothetical protein
MNIILEICNKLFENMHDKPIPKQIKPMHKV